MTFIGVMDTGIIVYLLLNFVPTVSLISLHLYMAIFCRLLLYPGDCHPINSVSSDADSFVNTAAWLFCHALDILE